ncbi:MAG: YdcH family protein [Betaproteobacteria bacterium]|nr:YdcH family protein [Betaproteobacteria bacterium]
MFPEYRDLISKLKSVDAHFAKLFERHNELDQRIRNLEEGIENADAMTIESLKKQKLKLKDELYLMLRKAAA